MKMKIISDIGSLFYMNYNVHNQINYLFFSIITYKIIIQIYPTFSISYIVLLTISSHFHNNDMDCLESRSN
jgi:hypothetical protein